MRNYTTTEGDADDYFDVTGEWAGYIVEKAALGYTVSYWSRVTGSRDGLRLLRRVHRRRRPRQPRGGRAEPGRNRAVITFAQSAETCGPLPQPEAARKVLPPSPCRPRSTPHCPHAPSSHQ